MALTQIDDAQPQLVLLDNDVLIRTSWQNSAMKRGLALTTFARYRELVEALPQFSKTTKFYIDYELDESNGGAVCDDLYQRGFEELFITTGHPPESLPGLRRVHKIVGKRFEDCFNPNLAKPRI